MLLLGGVVLVYVGLLERRGRLPRNRWVGIRTRTTMASDAAWTAAHRATSWSSTASGALLVVTGLGLLVLRPSGDGAAAVATGAVAIIALLVLIGGIQAQRAAKDVG